MVLVTLRKIIRGFPTWRPLIAGKKYCYFELLSRVFYLLFLPVISDRRTKLVKFCKPVYRE